MAQSKAMKTVRFTRRHKTSGRVFVPGDEHLFFHATARALVNRGLAEYAGASKPRKTRKPRMAPENKAFTTPAENKSSFAHVDSMDKEALIQWLDTHSPEHGYDKRYGAKTLRKAVKDIMKTEG